MTTVFTSAAIEAAPEATATHVLIIGVGAYPDLKRTSYSAIEPLGSPPLSATAIADWFLGAVRDTPGRGFHNPAAPLGSVEMLVSPVLTYKRPFGSAETILDTPNIENIRVAYNTWLDRLGQNANSRGVFYFCGHGLIDGNDQVVLADDFGCEGNRNLWSRAFNVSKTIQVTIRQAPATLFFFIDACMQFSKKLRFEMGFVPQALDSCGADVSPLTTEWAILRGASTGRQAFGPEDGVSRFTNALLKGLSGFCGKKIVGANQHTITWPDLREAIAAFLEHLSRNSVYKSTMSGAHDGRADVPLHVLDRKPDVWLELDVSPNGYRRAARVFVENEHLGRKDSALEEGPGIFVIPKDTYYFGAESVGGAFGTQRISDLLQPPLVKYTFSIS
jgi:hypothetical protein